MKTKKTGPGSRASRPAKAFVVLARGTLDLPTYAPGKTVGTRELLAAGAGSLQHFDALGSVVLLGNDGEFYTLVLEAAVVKGNPEFVLEQLMGHMATEHGDPEKPDCILAFDCPVPMQLEAANSAVAEKLEGEAEN